MAKGSVQVPNTPQETLSALGATVGMLSIIQAALADPNYIPALAKQVAESEALTQPEKDARDAALLTISTAQDKLDAIQLQYSQTQQKIADAQNQSDENTKAANFASDQYVASANKTIAEKWKELDDYKKSIDDAADAVTEREVSATNAENANKAKSDDLDAKESTLNAFSQKLAERLTVVTGLEQAALTA